MARAAVETRTSVEGAKALCSFPKLSGPNKGEPCNNIAGARTDHLGYGHCWKHLGKTETGKIHAAREIAVETRETIAASWSGKGDDLAWLTPELAVLLELRRTWRIVAYYDAEIESHLKAGGSVLEEMEEGFKIAAWTKAHRDERQHLVRTSKVAIDAGVQERMLHLMEVQAVELATGIRRILDGLGLSADQARRAPDLVRSVLSQLAIESQASEVEP